METEIEALDFSIQAAEIALEEAQFEARGQVGPYRLTFVKRYEGYIEALKNIRKRLVEEN